MQLLERRHNHVIRYGRSRGEFRGFALPIVAALAHVACIDAAPNHLSLER